jgi:hypothetical protein
MKTREDLIKMGLTDLQIRIYLPPPKKIKVSKPIETNERNNGKAAIKSKVTYQYIDGWDDSVVTKNLDHLRKYTLINI